MMALQSGYVMFARVDRGRIRPRHHVEGREGLEPEPLRVLVRVVSDRVLHGGSLIDHFVVVVLDHPDQHHPVVGGVRHGEPKALGQGHGFGPL